MAKTGEAMADYIRFIKKIGDEDGLLPFDRDGHGRPHRVRHPDRRAASEKLSTRFHVIADVIRESSYWARKDGRTAVGRDDVEKAVRERFERVSLIEDKIQEMIEEGHDHDRHRGTASSARSTACPSTTWASSRSASRPASRPGRPSAGPGSSTSSARPT